MESVESLRLSEIELLMSMFSREGEMTFSDPSELVDLRTAVENQNSGSLSVTKSRITFALKLKSNDSHEVEATFGLPYNYPEVQPDISIRCCKLSRTSDQRMNEALQEHIGHLETREPMIMSIVSWIVDKVDAYVNESTKETVLKISSNNSISFCRSWIYSHHIYNKTKRKTILDSAKDLSLTGFCVPGKPGIICVEGELQNANEFWQQIRAMQWKKISLKHQETFTDVKLEDFANLRKFDELEEKCFLPRSGRGRDVHMDRGLLLQFLQEKGCEEIFKIYFGFDSIDPD